MTISEAVNLAVNSGKCIKRERWNITNPTMFLRLDSDWDSVWVEYADNKTKSISKWWHPTLDDLTAEDWVLVEAIRNRQNG